MYNWDPQLIDVMFIKLLYDHNTTEGGLEVISGI